MSGFLGADGRPIHVDGAQTTKPADDRKVRAILSQSLLELDELLKSGVPKTPEPETVGPAKEDRACSVVLEEYTEGVTIPDPGNPIHWMMAGGQLTYRLLAKLKKHREDSKRQDLFYTMAWSVNMDGNRGFIKVTIGLP